MSDEIKVNSENTPRKNLATLGQVKDALGKRDEKIGSLKSELVELKTENGITYSGLIISGNEYDIPLQPNTKYKIIFSNTSTEQKEVLMRLRRNDKTSSRELTTTLPPNAQTEYELETREIEYYVRLGKSSGEFDYYVDIVNPNDKFVKKAELNLIKEELKTEIDNELNVVDTLVSSIEKAINGESYDKYSQKIGTDYLYEKYFMFVPLDKYVAGDTITIFNPFQTDGAYSTYFCDNMKTSVQNVTVSFVDGYADVVYPKYGAEYAYIRIPASKESDFCYTVIKHKGLAEIVDSDECQNILNYFADTTGSTDIAPLINKIIAERSVRLFFPSGKYLLETPIYHNGKNFSMICDKDVEFIVNSSPIFTTFKLAGANTEPYSLGSFEISGGKWTRTREFDDTSDKRDTGFQVTKLDRVTIKDASFDVLVQSNHLFDVSGSKNVVIEGCKFSGTYFNASQKPTDKNGNFEMLQIDLASGIDVNICTENGHNECSKHISIRNCIFSPNGNTNEYMYRPIGIHFAGTKIDNVVDYYENISIEHNEFKDVLGRAIEVSCSKNVSIIGNTFYQNTEIIDSIIKCGSVKWENTSSWAVFGNTPDIERYNCINVNISDNLLNCSVVTQEKFIEAFPNVDTSDMYVDTLGNNLSKMGKNITITGNTGNLPILVKNVHILEIRKNDVPNIELDNNTSVYSDVN